MGQEDYSDVNPYGGPIPTGKELNPFEKADLENKKRLEKF